MSFEYHTLGDLLETALLASLATLGAGSGILLLNPLRDSATGRCEGRFSLGHRPDRLFELSVMQLKSLVVSGPSVFLAASPACCSCSHSPRPPPPRSHHMIAIYLCMYIYICIYICIYIYIP